MTIFKSIVFVLMMSSFFLKAQNNFNKIDSLSILIKNQNGIEKAESQRILSVLYFRKNIFEQALKHAIESLNYFTENNLDSTAMYVHNTIGFIYERTEQFERAEEHYLIALSRFKKFKVSEGIIMVNINLAILFLNNKDYLKSEKYNLHAIEIAKEIQDTFRLIKTYSNLSYTYFLSNQFDKSIESIDSGLYYVYLCPKNEKYLNRENGLKINLAENYVKLKQYNKTIIILEEILLHKNKLNLNEIRDVYRMYSIVSEKLGFFQRAHSYLKKEMYYSDSLNRAINNESLMELTITNELKYKEQESELELKKNELKLADQKYLSSLLKLGFVALIIIFFVFLVFYLKTIAKNKQLVETNLKMLKNQENILPQIKIKSQKKSFDISEDKKLTLINELNKFFKEDEIFKDDTLTVNSLAKQLNTNRNYLSIVIKEINPDGFLDFVNEYRIRKSWTLLSNPDYFHLTIEHISKQVGFKSQPTFNKAFKKFTGVTPSFYLKEAKNNLK